MEFNKLLIGEPMPRLALWGDQAAGALAYLLSASGLDVRRPERNGDKVQIDFFSQTNEGGAGSLRHFIFSLMAEKFYSEEEIKKMHSEIMESTKRVGVVCLTPIGRRGDGQY